MQRPEAIVMEQQYYIQRIKSRSLKSGISKDRKISPQA
jgi:hypothetical protein